MSQVVVCTCSSHTWRNSLTIGKEYTVLRAFNNAFEIKCDDGKVRVYRVDRFNQKS